MKWIAPVLAYLAVAIGIFWFHSGWGALVTFHLAIIIFLLIARPNIPVRILFESSNIKWILINLFLCASSGIILYFLWDKFGIVKDISARVVAMGLDESNWLAFITYFTLVNPLVEEYFWRGYLGSTTRNLHISDLLYSGFHGLVLLDKVQPGMILLCLGMLVLAAWFWRQIARRDHGLLAPVLGHMAADLTILVAVYLNV